MFCPLGQTIAKSRLAPLASVWSPDDPLVEILFGQHVQRRWAFCQQKPSRRVLVADLMGLLAENPSWWHDKGAGPSMKKSASSEQRSASSL
mmetsp:Transcript_127523/g.318425  ORF Transcript_127523/g.318425 Transcript_127523/m.318425 type:complete len:91 (+) Transcript_127523:76-348(+)